MSALIARPREIVLPPWPMTTMAEQAYRRLGPWTFPDQANGFVLAGLVEALTAVFGWIDDLARNGYEALLDPARCPWWALRWCGQAYGVVLLPKLQPFQRPALAVEERWRQEIADRPTWRRGHPDTIVAAVLKHMKDEPRLPLLRERYDPDNTGVDSPYHFQVRVQAADVLPGHEAELVKAVTAAKPVRLVAHVLLTDDRDYDLGRTRAANYDAARTLNADYDAARRSS